MHSLHGDNLFLRLGIFSTHPADDKDFVPSVPIDSIFQSQHCVMGIGRCSKMGDHYFWE